MTPTAHGLPCILDCDTFSYPVPLRAGTRPQGTRGARRKVSVQQVQKNGLTFLQKVIAGKQCRLVNIL